MMKNGASTVAAWCAVVLVVAARLHGTAAVECTPAVLLPCDPAATAGMKPTAECCSVLKEQQPCLCQYFNDPNLRNFIDIAKAKEILAACAVPFPICTSA